MVMVPTEIDQVTLYKNGALVQRQGRARAGEVAVSGLPLLLVWDTFRVRPATGSVNQVTERAFVEVTGGHENNEVTAEQQERKLDLLVQQTRSRNIATLIAALSKAHPSNAGNNKALERILSPMPHWASMPDWIDAEVDRLLQEQSVADRKIEDIKRDIAREARRTPPHADPTRAFRGATFSLQDVPADLEVPFTVEYFVPAARWVPTYALDLVGDNGQLTLFAMVANATGEPWTGARLSFSTVDLARETTLPEVLSWRIGRAQDKRRPAFRPLPPNFDALFSAYDRGADRAVVEPTAPASIPPPVPAAARMMTNQRPQAMPAAALASTDLGGAGSEIDAMYDMDEGSDEFDMMESAMEPEMERGLEAPGAPPMSRSSGMFGGGAPSKKRARRSETAIERITAGVSEPLPPSLRTMSMRLQGPDQSQRGLLIPTSDREHVVNLIDPIHAEKIRQAFAALDRAAGGLWTQPLPHGTEALDDATPPSTFDGTTKTLVPDDGEFHRVAVKQMRTSGEAELRVVPRESDDVFRFFMFDLEPGIALPSGPLDVTEAGTFRVRSRLTTSGTSRTLNLNLGVEPGLRVLGRVARVRQEEKGIMSSASVIEHTVELTLRNTQADSCRLRVFDRLPVPDVNEKEIEVALIKSDPPCVSTDKGPNGVPLEGGVEWKLVVESGETLKVVHSYQIKLPAKTEVVGGNRRE